MLGRQPIPEYYRLTLKISRDRGTKARRVVCDKRNASVTPCPDGYFDGDVFIDRSLNDGCSKSVSRMNLKMYYALE